MVLQTQSKAKQTQPVRRFLRLAARATADLIEANVDIIYTRLPYSNGH
jgi:hypothetical protein